MMKAYTDIEQSKKLAEILPVESADMYWKNGVSDKYIQCFTPFVETGAYMDYDYDVPCWSLTALLNIISNIIYSIDEDANLSLSSYKNVKWDLLINNLDLETVTKLDPIAACYEMIIRLHERKLL